MTQQKTSQAYRMSRLTVAMLCCLPLWANGQDIHFSQIDVNPILYSPAYSGFFDGKGRFGITYRNQWASVSTPYQTFAASGEYSLLPGRYRRNGLSLGGFVYNDRAGSLNYGTISANGILSYYQSISSSNNTLMSFAVEGGYSQCSMNEENAIFSDPTEIINSPTGHYFTVGAGVALFHQAADNLNFRFGLSGRNLNRPQITFTGMEGNFIDRKLNSYLRMEYRYATLWSLLPMAAIQLQHNNTEIVGGCDIKYHHSETAGNHIAYSAGIYYRHKDALIFNVAAEINAFVVSFNYDANLSPLIAASNSIGALELTLIYRLTRSKNKTRPIPCATF